MADNETTADIIAEMRRNFADGNPYYAAGLPDRLEAAHRRERGDAAKLREALRECAQYIACVAGVGVGAVTINDEVRLIPEELTQKAIAVLAAPPRNCDLARDWMRDLYAHFQPPASVKREMPPEWVDAVMAFCRWLVAPATEKEGGAK